MTHWKSKTPAACLAIVLLASSAGAQGYTGGYAGAQIGYGDVSTGATGVEGDDVLFGVHAGYNFDMGGYILGGEIDYDYTDLALSGESGTLDSVARLKLKGGVDVSGTLLYATAGFAYATTSDLGDDDGYFIGLGAAYDLGNNVTIGGEYLFHEFDDFNGSGINIDADTLSARVSFSF